MNTNTELFIKWLHEKKLYSEYIPENVMRAMFDVWVAAQTLPPELQEMRKRLLNQDNRCTAHPMYIVQEFGSGREHGHWKFVTVFFTNQEADKFIDLNYHNYNDLRVYVASGHNNQEWQAIRKLLIGDGRDD